MTAVRIATRIAGAAAALTLYAGLCSLIVGADQAWPHEWFPAECCNDGDCDVIPQSMPQMTREGMRFPNNPEVVPYNSPKIRQTPPEGDGAFALCTEGGVEGAPIICVYVPTWGS